MSEIFRNINKKEWALVLAMALVLIFLTSFPLVYGYLVKPADKFFPALHSIGPGDYNVYYSYLEQARAGKKLFYDLYAAENQNPFIFNPLWLVVGLFGKSLHFSNILTFQLARLLLVFPFTAILYLLISYIFNSVTLRRYVFVFSLFASGLGGYFSSLIKFIYGTNFKLDYYPMDLWVSESFNFLTVNHSAHFIMATLLIMLIFLFMFISLKSKKWSYTIYAGLLGLFLIFFHPFHLITMSAVILVWIGVESFYQWRLKWDYLKKYLVFMLLVAPAILYHFMLLIYNPIAIGRAAQNICLTPSFWIILTSYGLLIPLALLGIMKKPKNSIFTFLLIWLIVQSCLIFIPLVYQRRLSHGLQIPLTIFAFWGLYQLYLLIKTKKPNLNFKANKPIIFLLFILFFCFSDLFVLAEDLSMYTNPEFRQPPGYIYLDNSVIEAIHWLKYNLNDEDVVLSNILTGSFIPAFSGKKVYIGHGVETTDYKGKKEKVQDFFKNDTDDIEKINFLKDEKITYLFYSQFEKYAGDFQPAAKEYLKPVYTSVQVQIYQVL